jgi:hypothetical protein
MVKLIATSKLRHYAGRSLTAGQEFDADDKDVHVLTVTGSALEPETKSINTEQAETESRRRYRRRDMTAEQ